MRIGILIIKTFIVGTALLFFISVGFYVASNKDTSVPLVLVSSVYSSTGETQTKKTSFLFLDTILQQVEGVLTFASQTAQAVLSLPTEDTENDDTSEDDSTGPFVSSTAPASITLHGDNRAETLQINVPFVGTDALYIQGPSQLATTTINHLLVVDGQAQFTNASVLGGLQAGSLAVGGTSQLGNVAVTGTSNLANTSISGTLSVTALVQALGGIRTNGADVDLSGGNMYAANIVNELIAGDNVTISGTPNAPIISAKRSGGGSNDTLASARARAGCDECVTDSDIVPALTITGGAINNTPIGLSTPATAAFTNVAVGTSTASNTLNVYGRLIVDGLGASSTFSGGINVTDGCVAVNGTCLGGGVSVLNDLTDVSLGTTTQGDVLLFNGTNWINVATSSLGFGDGTFLSLSDTPSSYVANALLYANAAGDALVQSANLYYDGTRLGVGTSSPLETLSVNGSAGILGQQSLRFYNSTNSNYVGFRASSSVSSNTIWNLPAEDGGLNQILVTDGAGNLRFADVGSVGGGSATYLGLSDTPDAFIERAVPFVNGGELDFSSLFTFDGTRLGLGNIVATSTLTVQGSVRFQAATTTIGLVYDESQNRIGIGADNPTQLLDIEGGSLVQRGARIGSTYRPTQIASINASDNINDMFVVGSRAYVVTSVTGSDFQIIDISDDEAPVSIGSEDLPAGANAVFVAGQYAYAVTDVTGDDFHVIDIADESNPTEVGSLDLSTTGFGVFVLGRYAYVVTAGTGDDFHIIDIADPTQPVEVGSLDLPDATNAVVARGSYAYVVSDALGDDLHVIDISDPTAPAIHDSLDFPAAVNDIVLQGNYAFLVSDSAGDDFHVIDISDPSDISEVGSLNLVTSANALDVVGRYAYVATAGTGDDFHVIDISSKTVPIEVGSEELASGASLAVSASGRSVYVGTSAIGDDFHVFDVTGIEVQSAYISSLESGSFTTIGDVLVSGRLSLGGGLRTGIGGVQTDGSLFVQGNNASFITGNVGIGTTSAPHELTIGGDLQVSGFFYDSDNFAGTADMVLQSTATGTRWVATSTLGLGGGGVSFSNSAELAALLSDETGSGGVAVFANNPTLAGATISSTVTLSGSTANIALGSNWLSGDGTDEGIFIDSDGRVGIGTSSPENILDVVGSIQQSGGGSNIQISSGVDITGSNALAITATNNYLQLNAPTNYIYSRALAHIFSDESGSEEWMRVIDGTVGIGTSSPLSELDVYGDAVLSGSNRYLNFGTATGTGGYGFRDNGGTIEFKNSGGAWQAIPTGVSFSVSSTTYTSDDTWNKPTDTGFAYAHVIVIGGGGSGGARSGAGQGGGGGGGGGVYARIEADDLGSSETVIVGAGGSGVSSVSSGNDGETSSFGSFVTANGGARGLNSTGAADGGAGGTVAVSPNVIPIQTATGGAGGRGFSSSDPGDNGQSGTIIGTGGGGGASDEFNNQDIGGTGTTYGGAGSDGNYTGASNPGGAYGGGSGGGSSASGDGGDGVVIVFEYSIETTGADLAELYATNDQSLQAGEIVSFDTGSPVTVSRADESNNQTLTGIVSTHPGLLIGDSTNASSQRMVALAGRVPTNVNLENGPITIGDRIALSSVPGVGRKAKPFESSVGVALESYEGATQGTIEVFIDLQQGYDVDTIATSLFAIGTASSTEVADDTLWSRLASLAKGFVNGILKLAGLSVGTADAPAGVTLYDTQTKAPYCLIVEDGVVKSVEGECGDIDFVTETFEEASEETEVEEETSNSGGSTPEETATSTASSTLITVNATSTASSTQQTSTSTPIVEDDVVATTTATSSGEVVEDPEPEEVPEEESHDTTEETDVEVVDDLEIPEEEVVEDSPETNDGTMALDIE